MKGCPKCGRNFDEDVVTCPVDGEVLVDIVAAETDHLIGKILDSRYFIQKRLGEGGMGVVYLAIHTVIQKQVAIKVLRSEVSGDASVAERFIQEARSTAAISNEHVIEINDFGRTPEGSPYFVMEYLNGRSLQEVLAEHSVLDTERALRIGIQCCDALAAAHASGVVHRDLKPENLILVPRSSDPDFVKVLDFGIAKVARESGRLTKTGTIFGTPQYMAPEQAAGTAMDERVDIYSLGVILYEIFCGKVPFEADTFMGVLTKHLYEAPILPSVVREKGFPKAVESVILKAMAKKPERRYLSMIQMGEDLQAVLYGETPVAAMDDFAQSTLPPAPFEVVGASTASRSRYSASVGRPHRLKIIAILVGAAVLLGLLGIALVVGGKNGEQAVGPVAVPVAPPKQPAQQSDRRPTISLDSRPSGAALFRGHKLIGNLPFDIKRPAADSFGDTYRVTLDGYRDLDVLITGAMPDRMVVELMPAVRAEGAVSNEEQKEKAASSNTTGKSKKRAGKKRRRKKQKLSGDIMDPWQ